MSWLLLIVFAACWTIAAAIWAAHGWFLIPTIASRGLRPLAVLWQLSVGGYLIALVLAPSWVYWLTLGVMVVVSAAYLRAVFSLFGALVRELMTDDGERRQ